MTALRVVLEGHARRSRSQAMAFDMPAYGWALNDRQTTDLIWNICGRSWGSRRRR